MKTGVLTEEHKKSLRNFSVYLQRVCNNSPYTGDHPASEIYNPSITQLHPQLIQFTEKLTDEDVLKTFREVMNSTNERIVMDEIANEFTKCVAELEAGKDTN